MSKTNKRADNTKMVWIDSSIHEELREVAKRDRRTIRSTLEIILEGYLSRNKLTGDVAGSVIYEHSAPTAPTRIGIGSDGDNKGRL